MNKNDVLSIAPACCVNLRFDDFYFYWNFLFYFGVNLTEFGEIVLGHCLHSTLLKPHIIK